MSKHHEKSHDKDHEKSHGKGAHAEAGTAFGIDIGGSGIKGAPVDLGTGEFGADRVRIPTPQPATPDAVARTVAEVVDAFQLPPELPVGVTFPAVILHGVAQSAANVDKSCCLLYTSPSPRDRQKSRMPSSA